MSDATVGLAVLAGIALVVALYWRLVLKRHDARLERLDVRIHVNGIRGKSTVTRLLAGVLREGGFVTVAKTTGSAARVIARRGEETPIFRRGAPTINEQVDIVREHVDRNTQALVIECMAVNPLYQQYSQDFIVKSDITVITNVREDHQEQMGETLEEIADSMSLTIPHDGVLISAEDRAHLVERLAQNASMRRSRFIHADPAWVTDDDMRGFDYLQFKTNVAIGLAVARELGIDRDAAIRGMWRSVPDIGVVRLHTYEVNGKEILWVPMFAANDRESVVLTYEALQPYFPEDAIVIGILNNRWDRGRRAELFAEMVPIDLSSYLDHVITFGAYEDQVTTQMIGRGYPADRITNLGETKNPSLETILETITSLIPGRRAVLVGMVNIHTDQAELLMHYFESIRGPEASETELDLSRKPENMPFSSRRFQRAVARSSRRRSKGTADGA